MNWATGATSVWADGEWVIAVARDRTDGIEVVSYNPKRDRWRHLPRIPGQLSEENELVWTGSELLLINFADGIYRLEPNAPAWTHDTEPPLGGLIVWTGDRLLSLANNYPDWLWSLVEWDPASEAWDEIPQPELLPYRELVWTGDRVLFPNSGYAFDPSTAQWWSLEMLSSGVYREDSVLLWAGDRLLELGGWPGGPSGPIHFGNAYIPEW
jgi:hypothetical protein